MKLWISLMMVSAALFNSCSSMSSDESYNKHLKKEGYSNEDAAKIKPYYMEYGKLSVSADSHSSTYLLSGAKSSKDNKLKSIFCNCVKKLGNRCIGESKKEFTKDELKLWVKGNAIYLVSKATSKRSYQIVVGTSDSALDPDECM